MRIQVDVDVQKALNRIARYGGQAEKGVRKAVLQSTMSIETNAKKRAPVDTGKLRGSIKGTAKGLEGEVTATAEHAPFVEFGTRRMGAQPYMGPAAEQERPRFEQAVRGALKE
ncbi:TPA: HK97-gp10 family putative phage morphogenesis protein [Vibrio cholerae]